jgi:hypothetical protein
VARIARRCNQSIARCEYSFKLWLRFDVTFQLREYPHILLTSDRLRVLYSNLYACGEADAACLKPHFRRLNDLGDGELT